MQTPNSWVCKRPGAALGAKRGSRPTAGLARTSPQGHYIRCPFFTLHSAPLPLHFPLILKDLMLPSPCYVPTSVLLGFKSAPLIPGGSLQVWQSLVTPSIPQPPSCLAEHSLPSTKRSFWTHTSASMRGLSLEAVCPGVLLWASH